jgi:hypothetical protein
MLLGCAEEAPEAAMPDARAVALDDVGDGAVTGELAGEAFEATDVRFRVIPRDGRERVDLLFSDRPIERCGLPIAREERLVWLRFPGRTALEVGPEDDSFSAHYEVPGEDELRAVHRSVAAIAIDAVERHSIRGRMRACFADTERSCVGGTFVARPCWSRVDGRAIREPPGLDDRGLEVPRSEGDDGAR